MSFSNPLQARLVAQFLPNWCWAASGQMIMNYLGNSTVTQCQEATKYPFVPPQTTPPTDWCTVIPPDTWGFTGWPQFKQFGFDSQQTPYGTALSWAHLKQEIDNNRPVAFTWQWTNGGGHMMIAIGYSVIGGVNYVIINDPSPPGVGDPRHILYEEYVAGRYHGESYTHWCDFYAITMTQQSGEGPGGPAAPQATQSLIAASAFLPTALAFLGPGAGPPEASYLAEGMPVKAIGLNQLKQLAAPGAPGDILQSTPVRAYQYPVMQRGQFLTAISTNLAPGGGWQATVGNSAWTKIFSTVREKHAAINNIAHTAYSLIAFNALNLFFLAYTQANDLNLIPTQTNPSLGFIEGVAQPASKVFETLTRLAVGHTGGPA